jgi:hypothetical protein
MKPFWRPLIAALAVPILGAAISVKAETSSEEVVTDTATIKRVSRDFERSLKLVGFRGQLRCVRMIRLLPNSGRDTSYGAICEIQNTSSSRMVMACDDTMIGKFTFKTSGFAVDDQELSSFTEFNCPPGG